jgi:hypothetical protein
MGSNSLIEGVSKKISFITKILRVLFLLNCKKGEKEA